MDKYDSNPLVPVVDEGPWLVMLRADRAADWRRTPSETPVEVKHD